MTFRDALTKRSNVFSPPAISWMCCSSFPLENIPEATVNEQGIESFKNQEKEYTRGLLARG
jgi:hypothetical protein